MEQGPALDQAYQLQRQDLAQKQMQLDVQMAVVVPTLQAVHETVGGEIATTLPRFLHVPPARQNGIDITAVGGVKIGRACW